MPSMILLAIIFLYPLVIISQSSVLRFEYTDSSNITCVALEISEKSYIVLEKPNKTVSIEFEPSTIESGDCNLDSGSFLNLRLHNGFIIKFVWIFTPEPFMEMFGQGFNTVGAEEYLLHGTYILANISIFNEANKGILYTNVSTLSGQSKKEPYQDTFIRSGNHYSCATGWNVTFYGDEFNATLYLGSVRFQAFPNIGSVNFNGYAVTCSSDHEHSFGFQGVLVFVCVGVVLVILVYTCIRISTLPSPLFQ